eukprot:3529700-Amphidinium_carterae.1
MDSPTLWRNLRLDFTTIASLADALNTNWEARQQAFATQGAHTRDRVTTGPDASQCVRMWRLAKTTRRGNSGRTWAGLDGNACKDNGTSIKSCGCAAISVPEP